MSDVAGSPRPSAGRTPTAAIIAIGDEIVLGQQPDTNSRWLAEALARLGVMPAQFRTLGDDRATLCDAILTLAVSHDLVISTGGLGPTEDDLTRVALNDALAPGEELVLDELGEQWLAAWFGRRARSMPQSNRVQAMRPGPSTLIENRHGTAPGLAARWGRCRIFCLPGPPREMQPMFADGVAPAARELAGRREIRTAIVRQLGMGESEAAERLGALMARDNNPLVGTTASGGIVSARVRAVGSAQDAARLCSEAVAAVHAAWHPYAFGEGDGTLAEAVHALLGGSRTVVTAESCTGGLLASMLVEPPGASASMLGGWVTYANELKLAELAVDPALLAAHGAVSREVVGAMALHAAERAQATFAIATSGIAGPTGGSDDKPLGTVFIAIADRRESKPELEVRRFRVTGTRDDIRDRTARLALQMLRLRLLDESAHALLWELREMGE